MEFLSLTTILTRRYLVPNTRPQDRHVCLREALAFAPFYLIYCQNINMEHTGLTFAI